VGVIITTFAGMDTPKGKALDEMVDLFLHEQWEGFTSAYSLLEPKDKIKVYTDLLSRRLPKMADIKPEVDGVRPHWMEAV